MVEKPVFLSYTDDISKLNFMLRRLATEFLPACIVQLILVELLRRRQCLVEIPVTSSPDYSILKYHRYMSNRLLFLLLLMTLNFCSVSADYPKIRSALLLSETFSSRVIEIDALNQNASFQALVQGKISHISPQTVFYAYSSEGVDDTEWGCAWRAIQTALSPHFQSKHQEIPGFVFLYETFGARSFIEEQSKELYSINEQWLAPHEDWHMWADPFVGQMIMLHYGVNAKLLALNGPVNGFSPKVNQGILKFSEFRNTVLDHFKNLGSPLVIDNGKYAMNILGVGQQDSSLFLLVADPHLIRDRDDDLINGLYVIELDLNGEMISIDYPAVRNHFDSGSYLSFQTFGKHPWSLLFPLKK